jgi:hypothetical protein
VETIINILIWASFYELLPEKKDKKFIFIGVQWHLYPHKILLKAAKCGKNLVDAKN